MKLTYRGSAYEVSPPIQFNPASTDQSQIKLIYRGHIYYTTRCSMVVPEAVQTAAPTVTLIYRGNSYGRKLYVSRLDQTLCLINWRYQIPGDN
jgi:hypothetical protein